MGLFELFKKKDPLEAEIKRRLFLREHGRITDGHIIDSNLDENGREIVFYVYTLNGVDFESSELLTEEQSRDRLKYAPGAKISVRYDTRNQGNSVID